MKVRLAHYSDIHLTHRPLGWTRRDFLSKKAPGWFNIKLLGRGARFRHAPEIVEVLMNDLATRGYDHTIFSGDVTTLGFAVEFSEAAKKMRVGQPEQPPTIGVPGNHDYYTRGAAADASFETHFAPWIVGTRIGEEVYPFARRVGPGFLIAVNSSTPNRAVWDASGEIGPFQLARLEQLCEALPPGPRILVTHYPLRTAAGTVEPRTHRLRDHAAALETAKRCQISAWLHGHIHRGYVIPRTPMIPFHLICAGSCTQTNRWSYNDYTLTETKLTIQRRTFNPSTRQYEDAENYKLSIDADEVF